MVDRDIFSVRFFDLQPQPIIAVIALSVRLDAIRTEFFRDALSLIFPL